MSNGNGNGNGNGRRQAKRANRGPTAGQNLVTSGRSDLHEAGMALFPFFETMINPEDYPPARVPDSHAAMSAVFKTPYVVDLPFSGVWDPAALKSSDIDEGTPVDGYSEVILCPGSTSCYFHTLGDAAVFWDQVTASATALVVPTLATHPLGTDIVNGNTYLNHGLRPLGGALGSGNTPVILPKLDVAGKPWFEVNIRSVDPNLTTLQMGFANNGVQAPSTTTVVVETFWDNNNGSNSTPLRIQSYGGNDPAHPTLYDIPIMTAVGGTFIRAFTVSVIDVDPSSHWVFTLGTHDGGTGNEFGLDLNARSACGFLSVDAPELGDLSETLSERTSALTGLLTYMGSTLQDGGQIAAARLGMGLSPLRSPSGDVYSFLASLPFYNDDYALREGIYSWWLPDSSQEHFYVPYRQARSEHLEENAVLQYAVLRDNPNQAVRLKVVQNLEVLTRSRLYTSSSGPNNPAYHAIAGAVKAIPAVTINKKHIGILGKGLNWVKGWVSKPKNWRSIISTGASVANMVSPGGVVGSLLGGLSSVLGG